MRDFVTKIENSLPGILYGIILIALALVLAYIAKAIVRNIYERSSLDRKLKMTNEDGSLGLMLGNLAFLLVILAFLPGILGTLGLNFISVPFNEMLTKVYNFLPNLLGAVIILLVGVMLAKVLRDLSTVFLRKIGVDVYSEKIGLTNEYSKKKSNLSEMLGKLIYVLILIPIIIAALNTLNISVISTPAVAMLNSIFGMIPLIIAALVVLVLGVILAKLAADLIYSMVAVSGINEHIANAVEDTAPYKFDLAKVISEIVRFIIIALFAVQSINILKLDFLNNTGNAIIAYIPRALSAAVILIGGYFIASLAKKFIKDNFKDGIFFGIIVRGLIMTMAVLASLSQLGIATNFILPLFVISIAGLALATALAFGLGGRDFASKQLQKLDMSMESTNFEDTRNKLVSQEKEKEELFERESQGSKMEYSRKIEDIRENIENERKAIEEAKKNLALELQKEEEEKERKRLEAIRKKEEEEKRRLEEERLREEERQRELELRREEKRLKDEERQREIERRKEELRLEEERKIKEEELKKAEKEVALNTSADEENIASNPSEDVMEDTNEDNSINKVIKDEPIEEKMKKDVYDIASEVEEVKAENLEEKRTFENISEGEKALFEDKKSE